MSLPNQDCGAQPQVPPGVPTQEPDVNRRQTDPHHQRAMDLLTLNETALNDERAVEGGGLRSTWSPDHEFENDIPAKRHSFAEFGKRVSKRITSSMLSISEMAHDPELWNKFRPVERKPVGWRQSFKALVKSSFLNWLLIFVPCSWVVGALKREGLSHTVNFAFSFLAIIPLCKLLEFGGENLALYCGKDFGDLILITLSNAIEAILALCLLVRCELKLLQTTIVGVVILRLLLIPGISFIIGGARVAVQELHPHVIGLNQSLLFTSVLFLTLPVSFFAALDRGDKTGSQGVNNVVSDHMRGELLKVSRGMAIVLIVVYVCSRFFIHNPGGKQHGLHEREDAPEELKQVVAKMAEEEPEMNIWVCVFTLVITVGLLAVTAEFLVESVEPMKQGKLGIKIGEEFFGLILLPVCTFSGDALVTFVYFIRSTFFKSKHVETPGLANYQSIESSIQFILLWTPFVVILAWCTHRPLSLLFDYYEMAVLLGACFLVNYVTADAKTNWAEGAMLVALYIMITLTTWFYPGQPEVMAMLKCGTVSTVPPVFLIQPSSLLPEKGYGNDLETRAIMSDPVMSEKLRRLVALYDVLSDGDDA